MQKSNTDSRWYIVNEYNNPPQHMKPKPCMHVCSFLWYTVNDKSLAREIFAVHSISSKCRENFCGFCFICTESAAIVRSIHRENFAIYQKSVKSGHKGFLSCSFCRLQYNYRLILLFALLIKFLRIFCISDVKL